MGRAQYKKKKWDGSDGGTWFVVGHRVWFVRFAHFFFSLSFFLSLCVWVCSDADEGREEREGKEKMVEQKQTQTQRQGEHE